VTGQEKMLPRQEQHQVKTSNPIIAGAGELEQHLLPMNDPYMKLAQETRNEIQRIAADALNGGGLGWLINCANPDSKACWHFHEALYYLVQASAQINCAVKSLEEEIK